MIRDGEDVEFIVHDDAVLVLAQREQETLVESRLDLGKTIRSVSLMHVHCEGVELLETGEGSHEEEDKTSAFDCFDGPAEQVGSQGLEILKDEHLEGVTQDLMGLLVVAVPDFSGPDEEIEGIIDTLIIESLHLHVLDLFDTFLLVTGELEVVLVAPKDLRFLPVGGQFGENIVEVDHLVACSVSHDHEHGPLVGFVSVLDQGLDTTVYLFLHC